MQKIEIYKTVESLKHVTLEDFSPFRLSMRSEELFCEKILRIIPKKRIVVSGVWKNKKVVAKIFFNPKTARAHLHREVDCYKALEDKKYNLPGLLIAGELDIPLAYAAIFTELYPIKRLKDIQENASEEICELAENIQNVILKLHQDGFVHRDPHPDNFLMVNDDIYLIDFSSIIKSPAQKLDNILLFYSQLPLWMKEKINSLFQDYCTKQGIKASQKILNKSLRKFYIKRIKSFMGKCIRNSTRFVMKKNQYQSFVVRKTFYQGEMKEFFKSPERFLNEKKIEMLKDGNACTLLKVLIDNEPYVVKKYNKKGWVHLMTHYFTKGRAKRSWQYANVLRLFGLKTPLPVGFFEKRRWGFLMESYFIMEYIDKAFLHEAVEATPNQPALINKTIHLIEGLETLRLAHGDLKSHNFIVHDEQVYLIDFDSMQLYQNAWGWKKARKKDIDRFLKNWVHSEDLMHKFKLVIG